MTTYPLPTLSLVVDATGISAPSYQDILLSVIASFQAIYGADAYLDADSQDGQLLAIFAKAIDDANQAGIAVYNQFSPTTSQGAGLSSMVKLNGLMREIPSNSTALVTIVGVAGTIINNGIIGDDLSLNTQWALPASVTIPIGGSIVETATSTTPGAVAAAVASLTQIVTPTNGWQTVTNPAAATLGAPVESDAALRQRQSISTSLPAQSINDAMVGALGNLPSVGRLLLYDNDTGSADGNGIPAHSICVVIEGGDAVQIATTIALKKTPGTGTFGSTSEIIIDSQGVPNTINFDPLSVVQMDVVIGVTALAGYVSTTTGLIQGAIAAFLSGLDIGEDSYITRLYAPATLAGDAATSSSGQSQAALDALAKTFNITSVTQARHGNTQHALDVVIAFNEATACIVANITVTVS